MVWTQIRHRGLRSVALWASVFLAATGFTVLTASSDAARLQTVGTADARAQVGYDILVRPVGTQSAVERKESLVQAGFLGGIYGGISLQQWHRIQQLSGISVAAPIAMAGYALTDFSTPVDFTDVLPASRNAVGRVDVSWSAENGLTHEQSPPDFLFSTTGRLRFREGTSTGGLYATPQAHHASGICPSPLTDTNVPESKRPARLLCMARIPARGDDDLESGRGDRRGDEGLKPDQVGVGVTFPYVFLIAAVDPASEQELDGLDDALVTGSSLAGSSTHDRRSYTGDDAVPVLLPVAPQNTLTATITAASVDDTAVDLVLDGKPASALRALPHRTVASRQVSAASLYPQLLRALRADRTYTGDASHYRLPGNIVELFTLTSPQWSQHDGVLSPKTTGNDLLKRWLGRERFPPTGADTAVRTATAYAGPPGNPGGLPTPGSLMLRGTFDPARLTGLTEVTSRLLNGLLPAPLTGADQRSRQLLGNQPLQPGANLAGLAQPAPLMLTTLEGLQPLEQGWESATGSRDAAAPISAIRVKVAGVTGIDSASRERVRLAAQRIQQATGLHVDIMVGSSATQETIALPAGRLGRPALTLHQYWFKKGVATAIVHAADRKSLAIFALVLLVAILSVANSAIASVRARRHELGVLACLGWDARYLLGSVVAELAAVGLAAGVAAAPVAVALGHLAGTPVAWIRAALAVPAALLVVMVAGLVPAILAARADPMDAVRPAVSSRRKADHARTIGGLTLVNLNRARSRTLTAALGLTVAVAAFTALLGLSLGFQGAVVGTVLGDAVAVQVRGADYAAAAATLLMATLGVAGVLLLNLRDRANEFATLRAVGWQERHLTRLVLGEGLGIGLLGSLGGAVLGLVAASWLARGLSVLVLAAAGVGLVAGIVAALSASLLPLRLLHRLPTALLLTEE
jgi:ABC-type antimicrobial peptide transport system permease subunit